MDGSHPKNIDPRPKRRRDEENPYEIYTTGINTTHPRYFLAFTDSNKVKRWMEMERESAVMKCRVAPGTAKTGNRDNDTPVQSQSERDSVFQRKAVAGNESSRQRTCRG